MKNIKHLIFVLLMILCIGLPCEFYQTYLDSFNDFTHTTFYCPKDIEFNTMISDIYEKAKEHNIMIFKIRTQIHTIFLSEIDIYADDDSVEYLKNEYNICFGTFESIVSGKTKINYHRFSEIPESLATEEPEFQLVGDMKNMRNFKSELINTYAGSFPKNDGYDSRKDSRTLVLTVWILAVILTCFFTLYETFMLKKENFIRVTLGESLLVLWAKYLISDLIFISATFGICSLIVYEFYGIIFMFRYALMMFGILIAANTVVSMNILIYQKNKVLSNTSISEKMLALNNVIRCITIVLTAACMSTALSVIYECNRFYQQKSFYESYSDYAVLRNLRTYDGGDTFRYENEFYREYAGNLNIFFLCQRMALSSGKKAITANHNSIDYIKTAIPELQDYNFNKDVYIIHRETEEINSADMNFLKPMTDCEVEELTYRKNTEIIAISLDDKLTAWAENPVIVYYNTDFAELYDDDMLTMEVPMTYSLVKNSDVIDEFMNSNNIKYSCTSVMDIFEQEWIKLKRTSYLSCILLILLCGLQVLIIFSIVKLEYNVNAIELSIKKVMGYSMDERFRKQYIISFVLYVMSLIIALTVSHMLKAGSPIFILHGVIFMYIVETAVFTLSAHNHDKKNVQKILKGGSV